MIRFECDYNVGAHPSILEKIISENLVKTAGYGEDKYCLEAAALFKTLCQSEKGDVHFLVGGTQVNLTVISAALRPHQGVICADSGHIATHESGAIEATGHKVLSLPGAEGKISSDQVAAMLSAHLADEAREHTVQPKMVYISQPTELGTLYSLKELQQMRQVCDQYGLILFVDGARLPYALGAEGNDLELKDLAELCDAFYFGGTKAGALFGEALWIANSGLKVDFRYIIKQKGGLLAKGRLLGQQFLALWSDDLYLQIAKKANTQAATLAQVCREQGYAFMVESRTNQQFPILPNSLLEKLKLKFAYSYWMPWDQEYSVVRFCTSWATEEAEIKALCEAITEG